VSWDFAVSRLVAGVVVAHLMGAGGPGARCVLDGGFNGEERPGSGRLRGNHTLQSPGLERSSSCSITAGTTA
jgi:hypothetical protein